MKKCPIFLNLGNYKISKIFKFEKMKFQKFSNLEKWNFKNFQTWKIMKFLKCPNYFAKLSNFQKISNWFNFEILSILNLVVSNFDLHPFYHKTLQY